MNANSDVSKCANPKCASKFVRFGDGELFILSIHDPEAWGLPPQTKQKVFWLCPKCCDHYEVRFDRRHKTAQVVHRHVVTHRVAS